MLVVNVIVIIIMSSINYLLKIDIATVTLIVVPTNICVTRIVYVIIQMGN